jgi:hypothetical protein
MEYSNSIPSLTNSSRSAVGKGFAISKAIFCSEIRLNFVNYFTKFGKHGSHSFAKKKPFGDCGSSRKERI